MVLEAIEERRSDTIEYFTNGFFLCYQYEDKEYGQQLIFYQVFKKGNKRLKLRTAIRAYLLIYIRTSPAVKLGNDWRPVKLSDYV